MLQPGARAGRIVVGANSRAAVIRVDQAEIECLAREVRGGASDEGSLEAPGRDRARRSGISDVDGSADGPGIEFGDVGHDHRERIACKGSHLEDCHRARLATPERRRIQSAV